MEKQRIGTKLGIRIGLLIFALLPADIVFSQSFSEMHSLQVVSQDSVIYSGKESLFMLIIPSVKPSDVQVETPSLPADVSFISMRRTDYVENGVQSGTKIDLWLTFRTAKEFSLLPLKIKVRNRSYSIRFNDITVVQDPSTLAPCFIIMFDNGTEVNNTRWIDKSLFTVSAGDKIRFTVFVQYAVQVMKFEWTVPKDALFTKIRTYEITEGKPRGKESFSERIPVGRFEWQPLASGTAALPEIHFTATAYNGSRTVLSCPGMHITVLPSEKKTAPRAESDDSYFAYAFTEAAKAETDKVHMAISEADCEELALLRVKERHSFFQRKAAAERRAFEKKIGLTEGQKEPDAPLSFFLLAAAVICALFTVVFFFQKKRKFAFIGVAAVCILFPCTFVFVMKLSALYGVFKGGCIHSVPDESSGCVTLMDKGQRVRIEEVTGKWMYVQYGSIGGWISSSSVIIIK
ncbi:MAG: hypothetical protein M0P01_04340 [Treponema sp.]|nr:hypothetical protein [Treponema sp.]